MEEWNEPWLQVSMDTCTHDTGKYIKTFDLYPIIMFIKFIFREKKRRLF